MYAELMNENVRIRAENVVLRKIVFALIAQADKDPFVSVGHFVEHGHASNAIVEVRAISDEQERQMAQFIKDQMSCS
jgi:hypothetical protein